MLCFWSATFKFIKPTKTSSQFLCSKNENFLFPLRSCYQAFPSLSLLPFKYHWAIRYQYQILWYLSPSLFKSTTTTFYFGLSLPEAFRRRHFNSISSDIFQSFPLIPVLFPSLCPCYRTNYSPMVFGVVWVNQYQISALSLSNWKCTTHTFF